MVLGKEGGRGYHPSSESLITVTYLGHVLAMAPLSAYTMDRKLPSPCNMILGTKPTS